MTQWSNKHNLPQSYLNMIEAFEYKNDADFGVTTLLDSPRRVQLTRRHKDSICKEVANQFYSVLGNVAHGLLEVSAPERAEAELRLYTEHAGVSVSGQCDLYEEGTITDYKVTGVGSLRFKPSGDWAKQLNCYAHLFRLNGMEVGNLQVFTILRDWSAFKARRDRRYPRCGVQLVPITLWSPEKAKAFFESRIETHVRAIDTPDPELPYCTNEERWGSNDSWSVIKAGAKKAIRNCKTRTEAEELAAKYKALVRRKPGYNLRCEKFCDVKQFCNQYKEMHDNT